MFYYPKQLLCHRKHFAVNRWNICITKNLSDLVWGGGRVTKHYRYLDTYVGQLLKIDIGQNEWLEGGS